MRSASGGDYVQKVRQWLGMHKLPPGVRKVLIGIVGGVVLIAGCALLVLPGPAFIVIPVGLLILASEFAWAKKMTHKASELMRRTTDRIRKRRKAAQTAKG